MIIYHKTNMEKKNFIKPVEFSPRTIEDLKSETINKHLFLEQVRKNAEALLWTSDILVPSLFRFFMQHNKSQIRFSRIFDQDPSYYLEKVQEKFPYWDSLYLGTDPDTSMIFSYDSIDEYVNAYKAFAVHFSDKEKDWAQLKKFYRKQMDFLNSLNINALCKDNKVIFEEALGYILVFNPKMEENPLKLELGLMMYLLQNNITVLLGEKYRSYIVHNVFIDYMTMIFRLPPSHVKSITAEQMLSRMTGKYMDDCKNYTGRILSITSYANYGSTPIIKSSITENAMRCKKEGHSEGQIACDKRKAMTIVSEADWKISTIRNLVFDQLKKQAEFKTNPFQTPVLEPEKPDLDRDVALIKAELDEKERDLEQAKSKSANLQSILTHQKEETKRLMNLVKKLEAEKQSLQVSIENMEELLSHVEDGGDSTELSSDSISQIKAAKVVVVGGHDRVHQLLQERCPMIRTIDASPCQLDANLIRNADVICFLPQHLSHSTFDNVKKIASMYGVPQVYQTSNNITFILNAILSGLKK